MKKLSAAEASEIIPLKKGHKTWLYKALASLAVGEAIVIHTGDWKTKSPPYKTIRAAAKKLNMIFDYGKMPDGSGWIAKRVK